MDELLIKRYQNGDHAAFKQLYELNAAGALRLARVITREDGLAADAVQRRFYGLSSTGTSSGKAHDLTCGFTGSWSTKAAG